MYAPQNIASLLTDKAKNFGRKTYIFYKNEKIDYAHAEKRCNQIARVLVTAGVEIGDRVAIMLENSPFFILSYFAVIKAGGVVVPVNTFLKEKEVAYIIDSSEAKFLISSGNFSSVTENLQDKCKSLEAIYSYEENAAEWGGKNICEYANPMSDKPLGIHLDRSSIAMIIYTSGTTGNPKGAVLSHGNLLSMVEMAAKEYDMSKKDRFLLFLPMFHIYSLEVCIMFPTYLGASIIVLDSVMDLKKKNFRNILIFKRPTVMAAVPTVYAALAKANMPKWFIKFLYPVKIHLSSGSGLPVEVFNAFKNKFGKPLIEGYGLSEASPVVAGSSLTSPKAGSVGKALPGVEVKIVDDDAVEVSRGEVGEIIAKGPNIMQGYWRLPKETAEVLKNGWFFTGDLGVMDEDGNISIVDRKKDLILVKGMNVYPREIEELLYKLPGVDAAAAIGIPEPDGDEVIVAYIKKDESSDLSEKAVKAFLKKNLANYKLPKHVYFVEELPLTTIGKVLKRKLKEMVIKGQIINPAGRGA